MKYIDLYLEYNLLGCQCSSLAASAIVRACQFIGVDSSIWEQQAVLVPGILHCQVSIYKHTHKKVVMYGSY